jgi:hypothetical protein
MTPKWFNYVAAWGFHLGTWSGGVVMCAFTAWKAFPIVEPPTSAAYILWYAAAVLAAIPLGWLLAAIVICPFVVRLCELVNGAPHFKGDTVCILVGKNRGRVAQVYEEWPTRHQVRVDLGDVAKASVTDVYSYYEVCRSRRA